MMFNKILIFLVLLANLVSGLPIAYASGTEYNLIENNISETPSKDNNFINSMQSDDIKARIITPFFFTAFRKEASLSAGIKKMLIIGTSVRIIEEEGSFTKVSLDGEQGYVLSLWLTTVEEVKISRTFDHVYIGATKSNRITATTTKGSRVSWTATGKEYVEFDADNGSITGISPGVAILTAKKGIRSASCTVVCVTKWETTWTVAVDTQTYIYTLPSGESSTRVKVPKGKSVKVKGDLLGNDEYTDWLFAEYDGVSGFVKRDTIDGFKGMLTVMNYYDSGYETRFSDAKNKITRYYNSAGTVLWDTFGLKLNVYVSSYESAADTCKNLIYGNITSTNISYLTCPKTGSHNSASCLTTTNMRDKLIEDKGKGTTTAIKSVWTGHIMNGHAKSNSESVTKTLVFTTGNTVIYSSGKYSNANATKINRDSIFEALHETCHQLGVPDHYCYGNGEPCSNKHCYNCVYGLSAFPNCVMYGVSAFDVDTLNSTFCSDCKSTISAHIEDHH